MTPEGLKPLLDVGIYGRIAAVTLFRPKVPPIHSFIPPSHPSSIHPSIPILSFFLLGERPRLPVSLNGEVRHLRAVVQGGDRRDRDERGREHERAGWEASGPRAARIGRSRLQGRLSPPLRRHAQVHPHRRLGRLQGRLQHQVHLLAPPFPLPPFPILTVLSWL